MTSSSTRPFSISTIQPRRSPAKPSDPIAVKLTEKEDEIFNLLDDFCRTRNARINAEGNNGEAVICRIAGGWVRDKILGVDSNDLDIAINTMTGEAFAKELLEAGKIESVGATIASNPEQSKHLETTRLKILGLEVDLVNLRSETYSKESRIPTIEFGTPLQDAERRDLTINALFYNAHTREVEDWTQKGLEDLKSGLVRTPLEPRTTFEDDPLRVLRCVRFASRLGFTLDEQIGKAAGEESLKLALGTKISRERIGEEIDKMLRGPDPLYAIQLLHSFGLLPSILQPSSQALSSKKQEIDWELAVKGIATLDYLLSNPAPSTLAPSFPLPDPKLKETTLSDKSLRARIILASALTPFRGMSYTQKKRSLPLVENVIREGLKLGSQYHYLDGIPALFQAAELIKEGWSILEEGKRSEVGILLRHHAIQNPITGSEWSSSLMFGLVQECVDCWADNQIDEGKVKPIVERFNLLMQRTRELDLEEAITAPPLLDGLSICETLETGPGKHIGEIQKRLLEWQLDHPEANTEEGKTWLREEGQKGVFGQLPKASAKSQGKEDGKRKKRKVEKEAES